MKRILIIGSKGFIGSYVTKHFSANKAYEVWGCDVVNDYTSENYFVIDAANSDYEEIFESVSFDVCINCSGSASVPDSLAHPMRDFYLNTVNVLKIVEAIRKHATQCKFLNISSAAVYGNPKSLPVTEAFPLLPLSPYGQHKLQAEMICKEYFDIYKVATCSLRVFSAYGRGLKKQLFWDIAQKAAQTGPLLLFGTGEESRDFIHVTDIARVIELVILKALFDGTCFNVANGVEISVKLASTELLSAIGWDGKVKYSGHRREGDPVNWCADISAIKEMGYKPQITLKEGLKEYAIWLRENG